MNAAPRLREVAVLVALRRGPLTTIQIRNMIADDSTADTQALLAGMITDTIDHRPGDPVHWYLTPNGVDFLERDGLTACPEARL